MFKIKRCQLQSWKQTKLTAPLKPFHPSKGFLISTSSCPIKCERVCVCECVCERVYERVCVSVRMGSLSPLMFLLFHVFFCVLLPFIKFSPCSSVHVVPVSPSLCPPPLPTGSGTWSWSRDMSFRMVTQLHNNSLHEWMHVRGWGSHVFSSARVY